MVRGIAIGLEQHLIVDLLVIEGDWRTKGVVHDGRATFLYLETHHRGLSLPGSGLACRHMAAQAIVAQHLFGPALLLAHGLQPLWGAPTAIGGTGIEQLLGIALIHSKTLRLPVGSIRTTDIGAFIPLQADPAQRAQDRLFRSPVVASLIRVFDTNDKLPPLGAGKDIIKQSNIASAHMGYARWTGGNRDTQVYLGHGDFHLDA